MFSCEFCEISKNNFSYRTPPLAASGNTFLSEVNILYNFNQDLHQITQQMCLSHLTDKILKGFDGDLLTGMILIDLPKAFDTINHEVLLQKPNAIKFSEKVFSGLGSTFMTDYFW